MSRRLPRGLAVSSVLSLALIITAGCATPRLADPSRFPALWDGDAACVQAARANGQHFASTSSSTGLHLWVPAGAPWARDFHGTLERGVRAARDFLGAARFESAASVEVYVCEGAFVAHAPGGPFVFLSRQQAEAGRAPWLHEVMHVLLREGGKSWLSDFPEAEADQRMPLWLIEGLADSLAHAAGEQAGVPYTTPFPEAPLAKVDESCRTAAASGPGREMLERIGQPGRPEALFGPDRYEYARVFYPCAKSFVVWLTARHGLGPLLQAQLATPDELAHWERLTGARLELERTAWLEKVRAPRP